MELINNLELKRKYCTKNFCFKVQTNFTVPNANKCIIGCP